MTGLTTFENLLTAMVGIALLCFVPSVVRWALLKLLRETTEAQDTLLEHRDKELTEFRRLREEDVATIKMLTEKEASIEERLIRQGAILYSQEVYIRRLERLCLEAGKKLPARNQLPDDPHN